MGLYITAGRFFVDAAQRARTVYGVTSERISEVQLRERGDGGGTIMFGPQPFGASAIGSSWPGAPKATAFDLIPDVRRVYDIIREAQRTAASVG